MKKGFTLIELLTVMMIMVLLGTVAVGGYRAMQRGMEERGTLQNVNAMIRAAYQRAQIDRQPTAVFCWNETLRGKSADENEIVVGRAVAVRRHGRLSNVSGQLLIDEFNDLNLSYPKDSDGSSQVAPIYIYPMDNLRDLVSNNNIKRSLVQGKVYSASDKETLYFLSGESAKTSSAGGTGATVLDAAVEEDTEANTVPSWAFKVEEAGGVEWKPGMAYGFEFASLTLPNGYIFGPNYSKSADNSVRAAGTLVFKAGVNSSGGRNTGGTVGRSTITIYSLRAKGAELKAESVGSTKSPEEELE